MQVNTIGEVIEQLDQLLARWEPQGDYRAVFARSYRIITVAMEAAIAAGEFQDATWMERLDVQFAQEYFDAVAAYQDGDAMLPRCWRLAFSNATQKRTTVLQDLSLGMLAHIVHDLPIALYKVGLPTDQRGQFKMDHDKVNDVLARSIDQVQQRTASQYSFVLGLLDRWFGNTDEILTDKGIRLARALAWDQAIALCDAENQTARQTLFDELDRRSVHLAKLMSPKTPKWFSRWIPPLRGWDRSFAHWL